MHVQIQETIFPRTRTYAEKLLRARMRAQNHLSFIFLLTRMRAENPHRFPNLNSVMGESMRALTIL